MNQIYKTVERSQLLLRSSKTKDRPITDLSVLIIMNLVLLELRMEGRDFDAQ